jgi:hypothetical protein
MHKYLYCQNNPVNGIDPSGRDLVDLTCAMVILTTLGTLAMAPATANAPGPMDATVADDGSTAMAGILLCEIAIGNLVKYAVGPALARVWNLFGPKQQARILQARPRFAYNDEFSGTAVNSRIEVKPGIADGEYIFVVDQNGKVWAARVDSGFHHNSLVPSDQGVLAAGNIKVEAGGTVEVNAGSGHYNLMGPDEALVGDQANLFETGMGDLLKSLGFDVKGVSSSQFYPSDPNPFQ